MKSLVTCLFIALVFSVQGQSKKEILKEINAFKVESIMEAKLNVEEATLSTDIDNFMTDFGYTNKSKTPETLHFYKTKKASHQVSRRRKYPVRERNLRNTPFQYQNRREKRIRHDKSDGGSNKYYNKQFMTIQINGNDEKQLSMKTPETKQLFTLSTDHVFFKLKRHLYVKHVGNNIELPTDLDILGLIIKNIDYEKNTIHTYRIIYLGYIHDSRCNYG